MVIDTSALLAILLGEPEAEKFAAAIVADPRRLVSTASAFEASIVIEVRKGPAGGRELDLLFHRAQLDMVPFTEPQFEAARFAWRQFGKGNHPAGLNFGDCFAYALAKTLNEPLLFKGEDFLQTDVKKVF
ncbi:MAG: type II toxin-antitoxin system VapC family toxin [Candidatus Binataceae bacterium]